MVDRGREGDQAWMCHPMVGNLCRRIGDDEEEEEEEAAEREMICVSCKSSIQRKSLVPLPPGVERR